MAQIEAAVKIPKLGMLPHTILDLWDELREMRRPADCVSRECIIGGQ